MKALLIALTLLIPVSAFSQFNPAKSDKKYLILLAEQSDSRVAIADTRTQQIVWQWKPTAILKTEHARWFSNMSEAKMVMNGSHILATASGGGVALIRLTDKKTIFYTYVGGSVLPRRRL